MRVDLRREQRHVAKAAYSVCWHAQDGQENSAQARGLDLSNSGVGILCPAELRLGTVVFIQAQEGHPTGYGVVRHCGRRPPNYIIGIELNAEARKAAAPAAEEPVDYYEFLQISPRAEMATIHRIYRFLAGRFHPDNPETGDPEKFLLLRRAFEVLSDPQRRADYDKTRQNVEVKPIPMLASIDFMDGVEGEVNRRMAVLSLLYHKRRTNSLKPSVSLFDLERHMAFPRDYLDFTIWYLRSKQYITVEDSSDYALTSLGVDYVESNASKIPMLNNLLNSGTRKSTGSETAKTARASDSSEVSTARDSENLN